MNIIYFTTASDWNEFDEISKLWDHPINPSNQVFHNKLIKSLSKHHNVEVISVRPFSSKFCSTKYLQRKETICEHAIWHYVKVYNSRIRKYHTAKFEASLIINKLPKDSIVVTDTMNPTVLRLATYFARKNHFPIVGICTDSPSGISGTGKSYTLLVLNKAKNLDGYIALTSGLDELYNVQNKPSIILEGLVEDEYPEPKKTSYGNYIFFAGSLMEKYGIFNLIDCYKRLEKCNHNLVICGHSGNENKIKQAINGDPRIIYLGNLNNKDVMQLEASSWACINPRIYSEDLDRYSIPSKVLEYFNSGVPTISVKNTKIQKLFSQDAIWSKSASSDDLLASINLLDSLTPEEYKSLATNSREKVQKYYSVSAISEKLDGFLYLFIK